MIKKIKRLVKKTRLLFKVQQYKTDLDRYCELFVQNAETNQHVYLGILWQNLWRRHLEFKEYGIDTISPEQYFDFFWAMYQHCGMKKDDIQ